MIWHDALSNDVIASLFHEIKPSVYLVMKSGFFKQREPFAVGYGKETAGTFCWL
jgi:hypothetical protein